VVLVKPNLDTEAEHLTLWGPAAALSHKSSTAKLASHIDTMNAETYAAVNNGVYRAGLPPRRPTRNCSRCLIGSNIVWRGTRCCLASKPFPELWDYTRPLYQVPGVAETVHFDHIKRHYYGRHRTINPTGVVAGFLHADQVRRAKAPRLT
jgi:glutathionyl-hydroquinone reductase